MRTQKIKRKWIDGEDFYLARHRAGLTVAQAADMLNVTTRTLRNWENRSSRIPYAAFRLMRLSAGYALIGKAWEGWSIWKGVLYSPTGRGFEPYQLTYLGNYLWMARQWLKERTDANAARANAKSFSSAELEALASDSPSDATASSGARGNQNLHSLNATVVSLHEKPQRQVKFGNYLQFGGIADAANDMLESEV